MQRGKNHKRWYYSQHIDIGVVVLCNIIFEGFLLFSMYNSLYVAVNICINCSFLHVYFEVNVNLVNIGRKLCKEILSHL